MQGARTSRIEDFTGSRSAIVAAGGPEQAVSEQNVEIIKRSFVRWGETGEPPWDLLHDDAECHDHDMMDAGQYKGRAGVERWLADWGSAWSDFSMEPEGFIDAGDRVVAFIHMRATGRGSDIEVDRHDALVYEVRAGRIARMDYYNNREQALDAVGLAR